MQTLLCTPCPSAAVVREAQRQGPVPDTRKPIHHVTVHVREGEQYRTFIRLLHKTVSQTQIDDESLPELSRDEQIHRFLQIRAGQSPDPKGSLNVAPSDMLVRRICITKAEFARLVMSPCNEAQSQAM